MADEKKSMSLREKLMRIQTEMKAPKNLTNSFGKYNYRNAEGILEALKPYESEYNVTTIITDEIIELCGRFYVKAIATIMDVESEDEISTTAYAREAEMKKGMDEAQVTGATSSYARKYALNALFLLDDTKDADSDEYHLGIQQTQAQETKPATKKADKPVVTLYAEHSKEEIKAKYQELIEFCTQNGYDLTKVCSDFKLNAKSSFDDFQTALNRLKYAKIKNKSKADQPQEV